MRDDSSSATNADPSIRIATMAGVVPQARVPLLHVRFDVQRAERLVVQDDLDGTLAATFSSNR